MPDLNTVVGGIAGPLLAMLFIVVPLVVIHELGHLIAARWRGIAIDEFGIGFPPRIATIARRGRMAITINALPIGGFVRMAGSDEGDANPAGWERASLGSKILVMVAGVAANDAAGAPARCRPAGHIDGLWPGIQHVDAVLRCRRRIRDDGAGLKTTRDFVNTHAVALDWGEY